MAFSLSDILGGTLIDSVKGIISQFHMSPEEKAQLQAKIESQQEAFQAAEQDYNAKLNDIAGQNIRAEQTSGDPYTERARPSVIWVGLVIMFLNYGIIPFFPARWALHATAFPDMFWWVWGTVVTGYVFNRTFDKALALPGDTQIKLPFGAALSNKQ